MLQTDSQIKPHFYHEDKIAEIKHVVSRSNTTIPKKLLFWATLTLGIYGYLLFHHHKDPYYITYICLKVENYNNM